MPRTSKALNTFLALGVEVSLISQLDCPFYDDTDPFSGYQTVGGELNQTSYITTLLAPALFIITIICLNRSHPCSLGLVLIYNLNQRLKV